jgi:hypothetical protein
VAIGKAAAAGVLAALVIFAGVASSSGEEPASGDSTEHPGLSASDATSYDSVIFTNTTPSEALTKLRGEIDQFEADEASAETAAEALRARDTAEYLQTVVDLICTQEESVQCSTG